MGGGGTETSGGVNNAGAMGLYDPNFAYGAYSSSPWQQGLGAVGKGLSNFSIPQSPIPQFGNTPQFTPQAVNSPNPGLIPQSDTGSSPQDELMDVIKRLLAGSGGYQTSGWKVQ